MASWGSEGSQVIEAAKLRLAAARAQATSAGVVAREAQAQATSAERMAAAAAEMKEAADAEVDAAKEFLKQAEKKWEVITVDDSIDIDEEVAGEDEREPDEIDIQFIMIHAECSRAKAVKALKENDNYVAHALMSLTPRSSLSRRRGSGR
ncbi:hypothetical protein ACHAWF_012353 [Thalassiosira exigua]